MSVDDLGGPDPDPRPGPHDTADAGPLGRLPRLASRQARLESRLARLEAGASLRAAIGWLSGSLGVEVEIGRPEIQWRASGLRRTGFVAQLAWSRLSSGVAVGLETPLAHALVDRLLGFDRLSPEGRLPISPVEWGILSFVVAETLHRLATGPAGPLGAWDLTVDRVGPDPFDVSGLGRVVTIRWPLRLGAVEGAIRLWLPERLVARWLTATPSSPPQHSPESAARLADLTGDWRARAGTIVLPRGPATLRVGGVLPLQETRLGGTPQSPTGVVELTLTLADLGGRYAFPAEPVPLSGGGRLTLTGPVRHIPTPREALAVNPPNATTASPDPGPSGAADLPLTLVAELGRVSLTLGRLADLKPGDVVELGRHSREPVELTSGGRLVARGELVQIDTELGVRVTHVFL